jgi:hypothetical protein
MIFNKTDFGKATLLSNQLQLPADARRVLLLCDGRRTLDAIVKALGETARTTVRELERDGLVKGLETSTLVTEKTTVAEPAVIQTTSAALAMPSVQPVSARASSNRSWAASKMYLVSILQLQRDVDSASLAVGLHTSTDAESIFSAILQSLAHISALSSAACLKKRLS